MCIRDSLLVELCKDRINYKPAFFLSAKATDEAVFDLDIFPRGRRIKNSSLPATFENIRTKAFNHFSAARTGDICIFYFSGHGSQMKAPAEFLHLDPGGYCQTLVLADSRLPGQRDLVDKELAWLSWSALHQQPGVAYYAIFDCCHAGSMLRGSVASTHAEDKALLPAGEVPLTAFLGYQEGFFELHEGKANFELLPHLQFSACLASEKSVDMPGGSAFTSALVNVVTSVAGGLSWQGLARLTSAVMAASGIHQHATVYTTHTTLAEMPFPGFGSARNVEAPFTLSYSGPNKYWSLNAGAVHGLQLKKQKPKPLIVLPTVNKIVTVKKILADHTVINEPEGLKKNNLYPAAILATGGEWLRITPDKKLITAADAFTALKVAWTGLPYPAFTLTKAPGDLRLSYAATSGYTLSGQDGAILLQEQDAVTITAQLQHVANWLRHRGLQHSSSVFSANDITATLHYGLFDRQHKAKKAKKKLKAFQPVSIKPEDARELFYQLEIALAPASKLAECFISCLYFTGNFQLSTSLNARDNNLLLAGNALFIPGREQLLKLDPAAPYPDLLKIIISGFPVDLSVFEMQGIQPLAGRAGKKEISDEWCTLDFELSYA